MEAEGGEKKDSWREGCGSDWEKASVVKVNGEDWTKWEREECER